MFEFPFGYILGSSSNNSAPFSGKTVAIVFAVLMAIIGVGWMMIPVMSPDSEKELCGGTATAALMCQLSHMAPTIGVILIGGVALVAGVCFVNSMLSK